jgi:hypothetical protein
MVLEAVYEQDFLPCSFGFRQLEVAECNFYYPSRLLHSVTADHPAMTASTAEISAL